MSRQYHAVEALAEATTTSGDPVAIATLTFTPDDGSDYFLLFSAQATCDSAADDDRAVVDLIDVESGYALLWRNQIKAHEFSGPQDDASVFGIAKVSFGASPGARSYQAMFYSSVAGQTVRVRNVRIIALKAGAGDRFAADDTLATTTSSSPSTYTTLTFTPASIGDYVILAVASIASDINTGAVAARLNHQTAGVSYGGRTTNVIDDYENRVFAVSPKINLASSAQTFTLQFSSPNNATPVYCMMGAILALRLDGFDEAFQGQDFAASPVNTTSTTYQNGLSVSGTPQAVPHLIIGTGAQRIASTSRTSYLQAVGDNPPVSFVEYVQEPANTAAYYPVGFAAITTPANSAANWRWQYKSETTSAAYAADLSLVILRFGAPTVTATASFGAAVQKAIVVAASADAAAQATITATAGADGAVRLGRALAATVDVAAQASITATASFTAAVQRAIAAAASTDVAAQAMITATAGADGAAQWTSTLVASLDAAASLLSTVYSHLDAAVRMSLSAGLGAEAAVQRVVVASAALDAALQTLRSAGVSFDAATQAGLSASIGADALVAAASARQFLAACDAAVRAAQAASVSLQAVVSIGRTASPGIDVAASLVAKAVVALDLALARAATAAAVVDGVMQRAFAGAVMLDGVVGGAPTKGPVIALAGSLSPVARLQGIRQAGTALHGALSSVVPLQGHIGTDGTGA